MRVIVFDELLKEILQFISFGTLDIEGFLDITEVEIIETLPVSLVTQVFPEECLYTSFRGKSILVSQ